MPWVHCLSCGNQSYNIVYVQRNSVHCTAVIHMQVDMADADKMQVLARCSIDPEGGGGGGRGGAQKQDMTIDRPYSLVVQESLKPT